MAEEKTDETPEKKTSFNPVADLISGITMLTRLPIPASEAIRSRPITRVYWTFPLVGLLVGAIGGYAGYGLYQTGIGLLFSALLSVAIMILVTGAFHEDGLADVADGFGGGWSKDQKLEIMKDSRLGTYGAAALFMALALKVAALYQISPLHYPFALMASGALSRALIPFVTKILKPARLGGLGADAGQSGWVVLLIAIIIGFGSAYYLLDLQVFVRAFIAVVGMTLIIILLSYQQIRGYTGDVLGTIQITSEIAILIVIGMIL